MAIEVELPDHSRGVRAFLNFCVFRKRQRIFNIDAKVSDGALDFCMTEKDLNSPQIARFVYR